MGLKFKSISLVTQSSKVGLDDWKNPEDCVAPKKHSENRLPKQVCRVMRWSEQTYHSCGLGLHSQNSTHPNSGFSSHPPHTLHDQDLQITMTSPSKRLVLSHGRGVVDIGRGCSFTIEHDVIKLDADIHQTWPRWREPQSLQRGEGPSPTKNYFTYNVWYQLKVRVRPSMDATAFTGVLLIPLKRSVGGGFEMGLGFQYFWAHRQMSLHSGFLLHHLAHDLSPINWERWPNRAHTAG